MDELWRHLPAPVRRSAERPDVTLILPALLIGEYPQPDDVAWLAAQHRVTAIVNLQDHEDLIAKAVDIRALRHASQTCGVEFHHFPVPDYNPDRLLDQLDTILTTLRALTTRGHVIYLHCNAGVNRAPTVAIAYVHIACRLPLQAACALVKARRACGPYVQLLERHFGK